MQRSTTSPDFMTKNCASAVGCTIRHTAQLRMCWYAATSWMKRCAGRITNHRNSQMSHYEKAPITEALIDIRVELSTELRFEDLHAIRKHVSKDYPQEETRNLAEGTIQFAPAMQASVQQKPWGLLF